MSQSKILESNSVGVNRLFVLLDSNQDADSKRFKGKGLLTKGHNKNL